MLVRTWDSRATRVVFEAIHKGAAVAPYVAVDLRSFVQIPVKCFSFLYFLFYFFFVLFVVDVAIFCRGECQCVEQALADG